MSELKAEIVFGSEKEDSREKSNSKTFDSDKKDISENILNGRHVKEETINGHEAINVTEKQKTVNFPSKVSLESTEEKIFTLSEFKENGKEKIKVEDFEKSSLQFQKDGSKHKILITENGNHKTGDLEESFSKKIEDSQNKFNVENSNVTHDTHLNVISKVEEQNLFKKDDTNSNISVKKLEKVKNVTVQSIDLDTEKGNGISVTHSATKTQTHYKTESDSSLKKIIFDPISSNVTSNLELSEQRDEATTILKEAKTNKLNISQSIVSNSDNNSFQTFNENLIVNNLSCEKSEIFKKSEQSSNKVKDDTHSQFLMSLDSNDPVSKTDSSEFGKQSTRHSDTQGLQKRLPVSHELTSKESSVGENIPLSISDDKKVEAETQENEKQCQVCKSSFFVCLFLLAASFVSPVTKTC
ncbi:hypothetical protein TNIN_171951 [Trichonephila inaurata madagascariensis]|uniref:Uncharacterized protein n=1 Tax=Trichonephila inaurata madagascariensis TaxID=2747483 RepID=A0A8X7C6J5_9ARAC|nr:hypothetical protein TNIN_171951 [Trichonephila inaurata madagascariensis]